ncbi:MAG: RimK family alpha-L-glutamate ligase [Lachnospiraceae bacterium]|nr:RimK family alpha-L-glutamate ligase [Lachnospiraceae bacterium]
MRGILVVNEFLKSKKFDEIYEFLLEAGKKASRQIEFAVMTNAEVLANPEGVKEQMPDFVLFWDKDVRAAALIEKLGIRVFNSSRAIQICDDKSVAYMELLNTDVKMPETFVGPLTFGFEDKEHTVLTSAERKLGYPLVIKENCGSFGAQVYLAKDRESAVKIIDDVSGRGYIIQEFVESTYGKDIRINMVGNRCVAAMKRINENDFRANITNGGRMEKYSPTEQQIDMATKVMKYLKLDFAGVDIMFGKDGEPVFCEVNSNAHFKNIYDCTGVNVANHIMEYIIDEMACNSETKHEL